MVRGRGLPGVWRQFAPRPTIRFSQITGKLRHENGIWRRQQDSTRVRPTPDTTPRSGTRGKHIRGGASRVFSGSPPHRRA